MIIQARIRLQNYLNGGRVFVPRGKPCHGMAKGSIGLYVVEGPSWKGIRNTLRIFDIDAYSTVRAGLVEDWEKDVGFAQSKLRRLR